MCCQLLGGLAARQAMGFAIYFRAYILGGTPAKQSMPIVVDVPGKHVAVVQGHRQRVLDKAPEALGLLALHMRREDHCTQGRLGPTEL